MCGGSGEAGGLTATLLDNNLEIVERLSLDSYFSNQYMDVCPDCGGTGYDPEHPDIPCSTCGGIAASFKEDNGLKALHLADGRVLWQYSNVISLEDILSGTSLNVSLFPKTSYWVIFGSVYTEEQWAAANGDANALLRMEGTAVLVYLAEGDGECPTCHGTGKVDGELYIDGEPKDVVLTNRVLPEVKFSATKTMDGKLAKDEFEKRQHRV